MQRPVGFLQNPAADIDFFFFVRKAEKIPFLNRNLKNVRLLFKSVHLKY